jgi:hypothetical protein
MSKIGGGECMERGVGREAEVRGSERPRCYEMRGLVQGERG